MKITRQPGPWIRTWSVCAKNLNRTPNSRNTSSLCMERGTGSSVRAFLTVEKRWVLNVERALPSSDMELSGGEFLNAQQLSRGASSVLPSIPPPFPIMTLQNEVDSLRKEKLEIHSQLFEA